MLMELMLNLSDSIKTAASCEQLRMILPVVRFLREKNGRHSSWRELKLLNLKVQRGKSLRSGENWGLWGFFRWRLTLGHPSWVRRSQTVQVNPGLVST